MEMILKNFIYNDMLIGDYEQAHELWKSVEGMVLREADSNENIRKFLERNKGLSFLCRDNAKLIGTVLAGHDGRRGYIYHLAVDPQYRIKGIAKELLKRSVAGLKDIGIEKCHLFVLKDNEQGISFWKKNGWDLRENIVIFSKNISKMPKKNCSK